MKTFAFIDASNLFYGGQKSLGWKIDYKKLLEYLKNKYQVEITFYFGGVELHKFHYDYLKNTSNLKENKTGKDIRDILPTFSNCIV